MVAVSSLYPAAALYTKIIRFRVEISSIPIPHFPTTLLSFSLQVTLFSHSSSSSNKTSVPLSTERQFHPSNQKYENDSSHDIDYATQISQVFKNKRRFFAHDFDDFSRVRPLILNRDLFLNVLDSIRDKPKTVLRFFRWASRQPGFHPSEASFFAVLEILAENELMRPAYFVAEQAVSLKLHGIVDFLIDGCISSDVSAKLLDLFLWIYTNKSMVELALSTFYKMGRNGLAKLMVSTYNAFIDGLCKKGRMVEAQDRLLEMTKKKNLTPDVVSYNSLIYGYCQVGDIEEASRLFDNLSVNHLSPTVVTYNTLIDGLCRVGALEEARKLKDEMSEHGLLPDVIAYTTLVNGLGKIGDLVLAKGFFDEMLGKGCNQIVLLTRQGLLVN
ncbi:hypothetical protein MRB53_009153 [Persea americana]|uniref:Uncharacterized protein n=1 Tax=Persea americana TaxID=3435 RepID=A0ACC2LN46_PERAE|nr:hypothetical protein MRB53_009153 [Persea americana]